MHRKQVDGGVRPEAIAHIGKEEVQPVKRTMGGVGPLVFQGRDLEWATGMGLVGGQRWGICGKRLRR